jgi:hypothetical protein
MIRNNPTSRKWLEYGGDRKGSASAVLWENYPLMSRLTCDPFYCDSLVTLYSLLPPSESIARTTERPLPFALLYHHPLRLHAS